MAANILNSVTAGETDFVVAATLSAKAAVWLKLLAPSFLESMLVKRFEKQSKIESKKNEWVSRILCYERNKAELRHILNENVVWW